MGSGAQAQQFEWKQYEGTDLNRASYMSIVEGLKTYLPIGLFVAGVPLGFIVVAIQAFIWAVFGLAIAGMTNIRLTYAELVRLAVAAMTPGIIIEPLLKLVLPVVCPPIFAGVIAFLVGAALTLGYFIFGIISNQTPAASGGSQI
jgi:hypothetical protein